MFIKNQKGVGNALFGQDKGYEEINLMSPDNTSDGWLKKKWKIIDGERCLLKSGSSPFFQEPFNEVLSSEVQKRLNYSPFVDYWLELDNEVPFSVCKNFVTKETELISAINIRDSYKKRNDESHYQHFLNCCENFGIKNAKTQIDYMLVVDYIITNSDRHYRNFGALRDANTLEWITIYYIGTRRDKQSGIDNNALKFIK